MKNLKADFDKWHLECIPEDGGRISVLRYNDIDILTSAPAKFLPPGRFSGEYETRPVYGYDDCFPTVDPCVYPGGEYPGRDHGELCWQQWQTEIKDNTLICSTVCLRPEVNFKRILSFEGDRLTWRFEVNSLSPGRSVFLHVMHALLPLQDINDFEIPGCGKIFDEVNSQQTGLKSSAEAREYLMAFHPGSFSMLLLKDISDGSVSISFRSGLKLDIRFDNSLFPTLGIWWNNGGYPEDGQRRTECAFEPIPGTCSDLAKSFKDGTCLAVEPGNTVCWEITWTLKSGLHC